jgi:hypothetical protein
MLGRGILVGEILFKIVQQMAVKVLSHFLARCNTLKLEGRFTLVCVKDLVKMDIVVIIISFKKDLLWFVIENLNEEYYKWFRSSGHH